MNLFVINFRKDTNLSQSLSGLIRTVNSLLMEETLTVHDGNGSFKPTLSLIYMNASFLLLFHLKFIR